jgi:hypothetical protein
MIIRVRHWTLRLQIPVDSIIPYFFNIPFNNILPSLSVGTATLTFKEISTNEYLILLAQCPNQFLVNFPLYEPKTLEHEHL